MAQRSRNNIAIRINMLTQMMFCAKFLRFVLFVYAFLSFVFWFLNCFEVDWLWRFNWLFVVPYQIVGIFYKTEGVSADFSLAIIGGISLLLGFIFDFLANILFNKIGILEEEEERIIRARRMQAKKARQKPIATPTGLYETPVQPITQAFENSKLLFLILPHIKKIKRKETDLELTFQEVEIWKQRVNKRLIENVNYSKPMQKGYYRKNLFLVYKDFNFADDFIYYIKPTLDSIILEFKKYGIAVNFSYVLSAIADIQNLENELDCMDTILSLNFVNEVIVTNRFKITYDNKTTHKYIPHLKGEYNLSKNLSISNRQPLYYLVEAERRKKEIK